MERIEYTDLPPILAEIDKRGFKYFDGGDYDLTIVGVRNLSESAEVNRFDDRIYICYPKSGKWIVEHGEATTDPGKYYLQKKSYKPCAIMLHDQQVRSAYTLGLHRGKYTALVNRGAAKGKIKYWRDGNKDLRLDYGGVVYSDRIGLNIHRSSVSTSDGAEYVANWSAGCQVWKKPKSHRRMVELANYQITSTGANTYSYCLIGSKHGSDIY